MVEKPYMFSSVMTARVNFPYSVPDVPEELIRAIIEIKHAAALAHEETNQLSSAITKPIVSACVKLLGQKNMQLFPHFPAIQGGAGTLINLAVNEIIAEMAQVNAFDHVNRSQSTNDVNPSALRIASIRLLRDLQVTLTNLEQSLGVKALEYGELLKLGRTHMQDAVPMKIADELLSWEALIHSHKKSVKEVSKTLYSLNLGGSAIGNGINTNNAYIDSLYHHLQEITHLPLQPARNLMSLTSSSVDFYRVTQVVVALMVDVSKIADDIRFLSSGPYGGIGEVRLPEYQVGSSIMPAKINPVIPESINQIYFYVSGLQLTIEQACHAAHLQLSVMFPTIAFALMTTLTLTREAVEVFNQACIKTMHIDEEKCRHTLQQTSAYATLLVPYVGYKTTATLVRQWQKEGGSFTEFIRRSKVLDANVLDSIFR